jgi:hypothetical protein
MLTSEHEMAISHNSLSYKPLDYQYINTQLSEAIEHLQTLSDRAKSHNLDESLLKIKIWDVLRHLNRTINFRHSGSHGVIEVEDGNKIPVDIAVLLGYSGKSVNEFVYNGQNAGPRKVFKRR